LKGKLQIGVSDQSRSFSTISGKSRQTSTIRKGSFAPARRPPGPPARWSPSTRSKHRRYYGSEYEPFRAAAAALDLPLSLHTATRRQGSIRGAGEKTLRDASSRATKAFYPALSLCDLIFSGLFERHPRLTLAIVEFELAWAPHLLSTMDYTYRERHGEAIYRFKGLPSSAMWRQAVDRSGGLAFCTSDWAPSEIGDC
jgi:hypothetical protein